MNTRKMFKKSLIALVLFLPILWNVEAMAGSVTLSLTRATLVNVVDDAGTWQHEGGTVFKGARAVGSYALHRRVTIPGTDTLNTAMTTMTLFLNTVRVANSAPRNITIEGAWDFNNGRFLGSVSAASGQYNWVQDADVQGAPGTALGTTNLLINWLQSPTLTLP